MLTENLIGSRVTRDKSLGISVREFLGWVTEVERSILNVISTIPWG